jgi:polysaccharide export outer membrane protein
MVKLNMKNYSRFLLLLCTYGFIALASSSCISTKSVAYFNNLPDSAKIQLDHVQPPPFVVQVNDVLDINIGGENAQTVQYINQSFTGGSGMQATVDIDGYIELPKIGRLKVAGLSKEAVRDTLTNAYKEYLIDPIINVKFGNFKFSVIGEVGSPGSYETQGEKLNIFEAVTRAGDITEFGRKDRVRIIREINGNREITLVNLNDKSILNSPNFYLSRYDIVYVESRKLKLGTENLQRTASYVAAVGAILAFLLTLVK